MPARTDDLPPHDRDKGLGPVPEANRPGHHGSHDQDKPTDPPPRRRRDSGDIEPDENVRRFDFEIATTLAPAALVFGVVPWTAQVRVGADDLEVRFGLWHLRTPLSNVANATVTGPYRWWRIAGPARLSLADGGLTLATTTRRGVCIQFHDPVPGLLPVGAVRHPAVTVTVSDPEALVDALRA
jgi:hypothetical protein